MLAFLAVVNYLEARQLVSEERYKDEGNIKAAAKFFFKRARY